MTVIAVRCSFLVIVVVNHIELFERGAFHLSGSRDLRKEAFEMFQQGFKLCDIAKQLNVPAGTVRRWKHSDKWEQNERGERSEQANKMNDKNERSEAFRNEHRKRVYSDVQKVEENAELNEKQRLFCLYYVRYFNATKAYQKSHPGCAYSTAASAGYRLLNNAKIKAEIAALKQNRLNQQLLDESDVFQKYMDIAFSDITDFLTFGQKEVPVMGAFGPIMVENPDTGEKVEAKKIVNIVSFRESDEVDGTLISEVRQGKDGASIKLADRMKALEWLAAHMNMATPEQRARVKKLEAETERIRNSGGAEGEDDGVVIIDDLPK